jgi:hypothetical protein
MNSIHEAMTKFAFCVAAMTLLMGCQTTEGGRGPLFFEANERLLKEPKRLENVAALVNSKRHYAVVYAGNAASSPLSSVIKNGTCGKSWFSGDNLVKFQKDLASELQWLGPKGNPETDYAYTVNFCLNFESFQFKNSCGAASIKYKYFLVFERHIKNFVGEPPKDSSCSGYNPRSDGTSLVLLTKENVAEASYTEADNSAQLQSESERGLGSIYAVLMNIATTISSDVDIAKSIYKHAEISPDSGAIVETKSTPDEFLDSIKKQCNELGFVEGSEGQNRCVLRLLK